MEKRTERHERVRFRRDEITALEKYPSAHTMEPRRPSRRGAGAWARRIAMSLLGLVLLCVVGLGTLYLAGTAGLGSERLKREASAAISALAGAPIEVQAGPAGFSLDSSRLLALEIPDVALATPPGGTVFARAGAIRFGVAIWPLLGGDLQLTEIRLADATIEPALLAKDDGGDWSAGLRDERGLFDPDLIVASVFGTIDHALAGLRGRAAPRISLDHVTVRLGKGDAARTLAIETAQAWTSEEGVLQLSAALEFDGHPVSIDGTAQPPTRRDGGTRFALTADIGLDRNTLDTEPSPSVLSGRSEVSLRGLRLPGAPAQLRFKARSQDLVVALPEMQPLVGDVEIGGLLKSGTGKVEFERVRLATRRSTLLFNGAFGPAPASEAGGPPAYRWEFVSNGSRAAAQDVPEPALPFAARVAGTFAPTEEVLTASEIGVRTGQGELVGQATVGFGNGAPAIALALDVPNMPVAHAKQLWPSEVATGARSWVLANVFGGTVRDSRIRFRVPAGRLGNGVALNGEEVNGHFEVDDTRFDITGDLPAVRDAFGVVDFQGSDVDISLSSGTVFMPTGRTLSAENGSFLIRNVESKPTIGYMDIDVKGEAPAVVEFASYKPIDAMRHLELKPEDFSGQAAGNVRAEIPLRNDFPIEHLDWEVDLTYDNLSIAQPFEGQEVTQAKGTIKVDPQKAVIEASAKLNGMPAELKLTEPLGDQGPARDRAVSLILDDAARERIAPGLNEMLSGPVKVAVSLEEGGTQRMKADLKEARLSFPWVGWSKGKGIPATATFTMTSDGDRISLSDFKLNGETFAVEGELRIAGGELAEARFGKVALNRGDDATMSLTKQGRGYVIKVGGASFDARSLIKLYLAETEKAEKAVESVPITLDASVARTTGFGRETLSDVVVKLRGTGTDLGTLQISARTASGAEVGIINETDSDGRSVRIDSGDAGALVRFLNIYEYMQGGVIRVALAATANGPLTGQVEARDFAIVNEPKLRSLISAPLPESDGRSLAQAVRRNLDDQRANFERGFALIEKGDGYLAIDRGVLRGPSIGATFKGTFYDQQNNMNMTGTFMPAYGINRIFGEIPLFGQILGNGRDRGLIGITFRLAGDAKEPRLEVNPLSAVAPGIFRSIFEYD
ncbi:YhdP family protein [Aquibium oceanicum]|uniref:YhdP central domain-containing protein n=1 Tax=Aquibium oceanicum TaxID=1670800 RepID=A0A1L3SRC6_9HYPH|nr:DUF3971 domain-containing protein [Aquibium oceanicum]APH71973.1 hypothetical protein BSQ44_11815 [Aquibium oceanicum]